jgi:putative transposase
MQGASMSRSRYKFQSSVHPHFLTDTFVRWLPLFKDEAVIQIVMNSFKFLLEQHRMSLFGYVIMPEHMHFIAKSADLSAEIASLKSFTALRIIEHLERQQDTFTLFLLSKYKKQHKKDRTYQVWQEGSHPQALTSRSMMRQKLRYIHNNPVKRGLVNSPELWEYSSASNYAGLGGCLDITTQW